MTRKEGKLTLLSGGKGRGEGDLTNVRSTFGNIV